MQIQEILLRLAVLRDRKQKIKDRRKEMRLEFQEIEAEEQRLIARLPEHHRPKPGRPKTEVSV